MVVKKNLAKEIAQEFNLTQIKSSEIIDSVFKKIESNLRAGESIRISEFGTFKTAQRKEKVGRNVRTGEAVKIAARTVVKFSACSSLKVL